MFHPKILSRCRAAALAALLGLSATVPAFASERVTFTRDIAPMIFQRCAQCHTPEGAGPFALLTYQDVKRRARLIRDVMQDRLMPPWLPAPGYGHFDREVVRHVTDTEIALLRRWVTQGAVEGNRADLPPPPSPPKEWPLGTPDLIVEMPDEYTVPAEGRDVYRNFVLPVRLPVGRWVRAADIRPGNAAVAHHALLYLDQENGARRSEELVRVERPGQEPGFSGMNPGPGVSAPQGVFLSWQPGRLPRAEGAGVAWWLEPNIDLVLQLHLRPSGKPERLRARVGLYFTNTPPAEKPFTMLLRSTSIDIPAGDTDYVVASSYRTPVALRVHSLLPHAHYVCREMKAWVELPDGSERPLIHIPRWNFDWQSDYRYVVPVDVPAGSTLRMRYTYDNSDGNERNPTRPPQRRMYGLETTDVMAELWLQVTAARESELGELVADFQRTYALPDALDLATNLLKRTPDDPPLLTDRAKALAVLGRTTEAIWDLRRALEFAPDLAAAHATLGTIYLNAGQGILAWSRLEKAAQLDPTDFRSINALGWLLLQQGDTAKALTHFERALKLKPDDSLILRNLEMARSRSPLAIPPRP